MKKTKILVPAIAVLALGLAASTTATVAWYQVQANGKVATSTDTATISAVTPQGDVEVELPLSVVLSEPSTLELAHWFSGSELKAANAWSKGTPSSYSVQTSAMTAGLYTAFHLNNAEKTLIYNDAAINNGDALFADVTITITAPEAGAVIDGVTYSKTDIANMLNGETIDIALARDGSGSRAMFFSLGTSAVSAAASGASSLNSASAFTLSNLGTTGTVLHFGMYVDGDNGGTVDSDTVTAGYKVTVTQHA